MRQFKMLCVAVFWVLASHVAAIADLKPVVLEAVNHNSATMVVVGSDGTPVMYSPADLETLPTYQMTTTTPWRDSPAVFSGVLLSDLLARHGLLDVPSILVTAENEFTVAFDRAALKSAPILVATRVNGQPHKRRARGPVQLVIAADEFAASDRLRESHLVWMAARIEPGR